MAEIGNREFSNMKQSKQRGEHPEVPDLGGTVVGFDRFCLKNKKQLNLFLKAIAHDFALPKFGLRHSRQSSDQKRIPSEDPMIQL